MATRRRRFLVPVAAGSVLLLQSWSSHGFTAPYRGAVALSRGRRLLPLVSTGSNDASNSVTPEEAEEKLFEGLGVGIKRDYGQRLPFYKSDITDGLNNQCLATTLFLFFACLAPAVGFGSLFATATDGAIGTIEMMSSTAACGLIYAIASAQPLTIIGSTGPVLAFVACLTQVAKSMSLPFLPLYTWTGLWTAGILFGASVTSASNLVKYLTRFTDEIFSVLISTIFVVEAMSDVRLAFISKSSTFTKGLLTLVVASVTYMVSKTLKGLRQTVFFNKKIRNNVSNFGPTIGVVTGALIARFSLLSHGAEVAGLPSLAMPSTFATTSGRPWLVPLMDLPVWARWGAILPAIMATVLLFLDQNITVRVVNNPDYKMEKGREKGNVLDGMHSDLLVISILTACTSVVGLPWLVAATVRSISHVRALAKYQPDGTTNGTIEQRVTGIAIHALIGCCVLFSKPRILLSHLPLPALMGLFLFLGTSALPGIEMWERIVDMFKESAIKPKQRWDPVPKYVTKSFTGIQIACLCAMLYVKQSSFGVLFPVVIAMLAPLRYGLVKFGFFSKEHMDILDKD